MSSEPTAEDSALARARSDSAEAVARKAEEATKAEERIVVQAFLSYVLAWSDMGAKAAGISSVAEGILLFPNRGGNGAVRVATGIGKVVGLAAGVLGGILATSDAEAGASIGVLGAALTGLMGQFGAPKELAERVTRNIAYSDGLSAFDSLAAPFARRAAALDTAIDAGNAFAPLGNRDPEWRPNGTHLAEFKSLINLHSELSAAMAGLLATTRHLEGISGLTDTGRLRLQQIEARLNAALGRAQRASDVYKATYDQLRAMTLQTDNGS